MPYIDTEAAALVRQLREKRGLSPEAMSKRISALAVAERSELGGVDPFTIRRIEGRPEKRKPGMVPSVRVARVVAGFFALEPDAIWKPDRRVYVAAERPEGRAA
jgi:hypothetical protein